MSRRTVVQIADTPPSGTAPAGTGRAFLASIPNKGNFNGGPVQSMTDLKKRYGDRQTYSPFYDWAETFFREGGAEIIVAPVRGPAPVSASLNIAGTGTTLIATATSAGDWANGATGGYTLQVINGPVNGAGYRQLVLFYGGVEVGRSIEFNATSQVDQAIIDEVKITLGGGSGLPTVAAAANLTGGTLDRTNITQTQIDAALDQFAEDLGGGQLCAPDWQTTANYLSLLAKAAARNRYALLDVVDGTSKATVLAAAAAVQGSANARNGSLFTPWLTIRGTATVSSRSVPPSAFVAAKCNQVDGDPDAGPDQAPAGAQHGAQTSSLVTGVKPYSPLLTDTDAADLETAGVNLLISRYGQVLNDGNRSLVAPGGAENVWLQMGVSRLRMAVVAALEVAGAQFEHIKLTRQNISIYDAALQGVMQSFESGLFAADDDTDPGWLVDTGPGVNTDATIAARQLNAQIGFRPAPGADLVTINLSRVAVGDPIA